MTVLGVKTSGTITMQQGKKRNTLGYMGNAREQYVINYNVNSVQRHAQVSFFRRLLGR